MLKYDQDCSYNGGGDAKPLRSWSDFSTMQYIYYKYAPDVTNIVVLYYVDDS